MIQPKKFPFSSTKVDPERSKGQIINLLKSYGVTDFVWAEEKGMVQLGFKAVVPYEDSEKEWHILLHPPIRYDSKQVYDETNRKMVKKDIPNYPQAYRFMFHYLKIKLLAAFSGAYKFEEEFMADIAVNTPEGPKRFAEAVKAYRPGFSLEDLTRNGEDSK